MQTLAQIMAGIGGDPYQMNQGISPLLAQRGPQAAPPMMPQQMGQQPAQSMGGIPPEILQQLLQQYGSQQNQAQTMLAGIPGLGAPPPQTGGLGDLGAVALGTGAGLY